MMSIGSSVRLISLSPILSFNQKLLVSTVVWSPRPSCLTSFSDQSRSWSSHNCHSHSLQNPGVSGVNGRFRSDLNLILQGSRSLSLYRCLATSSIKTGPGADSNKKTAKYVRDEKASIGPNKSFTEQYKETVAEVEGKLKTKTGGLGVKALFKKYGIPFFIWYSTLYFGGMVTVYAVLESGLVGEAGVVEWLRMTPLADYYDLNKINPKMGNFAGAVAINEVMELIRLPVAIVTIPYIKAAWDKRKSSGQPKS